MCLARFWPLRSDFSQLDAFDVQMSDLTPNVVRMSDLTPNVDPECGELFDDTTANLV
jgi:hypothetical protein